MPFGDPDILSTPLSFHPHSTHPMGHQLHVYFGKWWPARCGGGLRLRPKFTGS